MTQPMQTRLIETDFPLRVVSEESVREKNIRHGHISTLHIWWARKPLAASRATALAALLPDDPQRRNEWLRLVRDIAPWEVVSGSPLPQCGRGAGDEGIIHKARALIREACGGRAPRVLDPFAGGGAIPLEALRLGCEVYALDYNPVAVLLNKAVLEYPQRFGQPGAVQRVPLPAKREGGRTLPGLVLPDAQDENPLLQAVKAWGEWVLEEARQELQAFYPADPDGSVPVGYYWMRTLPCQNPACGAEIPLTANWWLAKKGNKKVALRLVPNRAARRVDAEIVAGAAIDFDPDEGTVTRAHVRCPVCGGTIDDKTTRRLFREGKAGQRLMAVVLSPRNSLSRTAGRGVRGEGGKRYRLPTPRDLQAYEAAAAALEAKRQALWAEWGMDPVPDEPTPKGGGPGAERAFSVYKYGLTRWGDLFNPRQKLALITFVEKVRKVYEALTPNPSPAGRERGATPPSPEASGEGGQGDEGWGDEGKPPHPSRELIARARQLRQEATSAEQLLWELLRNRQLLGRKFRRQHPIGRFIADFFCDDANLVIEIDGAIHQEASQQERDRVRAEALQQYGYYLLRFSNEQVLHHTEDVLQAIADFVATHSFEEGDPHPRPLSHSVGEGGFALTPGPSPTLRERGDWPSPPAPLPHCGGATPPSPEASGEGGQGDEADFAKAVVTYLALAVCRLTDRNSVLCRVIPQTEAIGFTFTRQALPMLWDYIEMALFDHPSGWETLIEDTLANIAHLTQIPPLPASPNPLSPRAGRGGAGGEGTTVLHGTATDLPWPDEFFDAVLTDPPYYDNVPYSDLSDFFYVWLKRIFAPLPQGGRRARGEGLYPDLFATPLTPKSQEMVADASKAGGMEQAKRRFEGMLTQAFREIYRVLKSDGIAVIVFAHKTTAAWEAVINALLDAGLYLTASWPVHTEMQARLRAQESAALASSIYMVCRKRAVGAEDNPPVGEYSQVRREIEARVRQKLAQFWDEGIRGADFFMSAIGPAVEAFGKYAWVEKLSGERVSVAELLEYVHKVVAEFALQRILQAAELAGVDALTRFYLLWRWTYNVARVPYDEARKLATSLGVELTDHWGPGGLVQKQKEYVLVRAPHDRAQDPHFAKQTEFRTMVDALQRAVYLWEKNQTVRLQEHLALTYGGNETFWQVAQAIADVLPDGDKEKQALQGLLYGRRSYVATPRLF